MPMKILDGSLRAIIVHPRVSVGLFMSPTVSRVCVCHVSNDKAILLMSDFKDASDDSFFWFMNAGMAIADKTPIMRITTNNSIRVNPSSRSSLFGLAFLYCLLVFYMLVISTCLSTCGLIAILPLNIELYSYSKNAQCHYCELQQVLP